MKLEWKMEYVDAQGVVTERVIRPICWSSKGERVYIHGYCHLRRSYRMFRADRIQEVIDLKTRVRYTVDDCLGFLEMRRVERAVAVPSPAFYAAYKDEILLLSYMAHADRALNQFEIDVFAHFLMARESHLSDDQVADAIMFFATIEAGESDYIAAARRMSADGKLPAFLRFLLQTAEADGVVTHQEAGALVAISEFIQKAAA